MTRSEPLTAEGLFLPLLGVVPRRLSTACHAHVSWQAFHFHGRGNFLAPIPVIDPPTTALLRLTDEGQNQ